VRRLASVLPLPVRQVLRRLLGLARTEEPIPVQQILERLGRIESSVRELQTMLWRLDAADDAIRKVRAHEEAERERLDATESSVRELQTMLWRLDAADDAIRKVRAHEEAERERLDWALGAIEGMRAEIDLYQADRRSAAYQAAYASPSPLVSVCIATMDRIDLLAGRCIPSLLAQTYGNIEIVIVGDNCIDNTAERLAAFGDPRIHYVNLGERGPYPRPGRDRWYVAGSTAMNHALTLCRGEFITHVDDDDAMVPRRIEVLTQKALETKADFLWHPLLYQVPDGSWIHVGNGRVELNQIGTGSIFYHRYFARFLWDVFAYRLGEPGDWNRIRRIKMLRPRLLYVEEPLAYHYDAQHTPFAPRTGERFLE
jgi:hypothetical protein